jgi:excisionase family DNA binding protein
MPQSIYFGVLVKSKKNDHCSNEEKDMKNSTGKLEDSPPTSDVMTVHDLAEYLKMSDATIYRMARAGQLPVIRLGKTWRFKKDMVDNWLKQHTKAELEFAQK